MVFPCHVYKKAYSCLAIVCLRWPLCKVVKHSSRFLTSLISITSHTNLVSVSSSLSSCMWSSISRVLMLKVAIFLTLQGHQEIRLLKDTTILLMKTKFWNYNGNDCDNCTILTKALFPSFSPDSACRRPWWATGTDQCFLILKVTSYGAGLALRQRLVHKMSSPTGN